MTLPVTVTENVANATVPLFRPKSAKYRYRDRDHDRDCDRDRDRDCDCDCDCDRDRDRDRNCSYISQKFMPRVRLDYQRLNKAPNVCANSKKQTSANDH
jgi:hypothetical protein